MDLTISEALQKKWKPILEHKDLPEIKDSYKKAVTTMLLENQEQHLKESAPTNFSANLDGSASNVSRWDPILISLVRRAMPNLIAYDPAYAYELAVIIQNGLKRMYVDNESVFYYLSIYNETYQMPAMPDGVEKGILRGMYLLREAPPSAKSKKDALKVQLLGSGTILREVIAGAELLEKDYGVSADIWSVTSFNQLRRDGLDTQRWNTLHPTETPRVSYVAECLKDRNGPVVAATDYMKAYADQIRAFLPTPHYAVLGTDGFGRSDTRRALRRHFEVDRHYVAVAALNALAEQELLPRAKVADAIKRYGVDPDKPSPTSV